MPYGESDLVVTLLTETTGRLSAMVRGARKSKRRFAGALEPFHTLQVDLLDRGGDLATLREARLEVARTNIASSLEAMEAGGTALRWARDMCPPRTPEPGVWEPLLELLDRLEESPPSEAQAALLVAALRMLAGVGWALELERCVACGRACPPGRAGLFDASRGGLVCTSCGGARVHLDAAVLAIARQAQAGHAVTPSREQTKLLLELVDAVLRHHVQP